MERLRRVTSFWNWLPAFRAVAETEHLPTASRELHLSTPALSRAVKLLERDVGCPLFRRVGRRIELNESGQQFLDAVRDGMRLIHEGLAAARSEKMVGVVRVASAGLVTAAYVVPALQALRAEHPRLAPEIRTAVPERAAGELLRGEVDVVFSSAPIRHARLLLIDLGKDPSGVYCGAGHPLFRRRKVTVDAVLEHEFVAPPGDAAGRNVDGWPDQLDRRIGMRVDTMRLGAEICAGGELLAVLPDVVAAAYPAVLRRLPVDVVPDTFIHATLRPALGGKSAAATIVAAVQEQIRQRRVPSQVE